MTWIRSVMVRIRGIRRTGEMFRVVDVSGMRGREKSRLILRFGA